MMPSLSLTPAHRASSSRCLKAMGDPAAGPSLRRRVRRHRASRAFHGERSAPAHRWSINIWAEGATHEDALAALLSWLETHFQDHHLVAAGHRVVHGGSLYTAPVRIDAAVIDELTPPYSAGAAASTRITSRPSRLSRSFILHCRRLPVLTPSFHHTAAGGRYGFRAAAPPHRRGHPAVRISRPFL